MDGATTTSTGSNASSAPGANGTSSGFLNLGSSPGGMGLFSTSGGDSSLANAFGSSLGNGFSSEGANNPSFDLNDFPSLGGGAGSVGSGSGRGDNGLAAALRQQQQLLQQQMMSGGDAAKQSSNLYRLAMSSNIGNGAGSNFTMATEDFPALPGAPAGGAGSGGLAGLTTEGGLGQSEGLSLGSRETSTGSGGLLDSGSQLDYTGLIGGVTGATSGVSSAGNSVSTLTQTRTTSANQPGSGASSSGHVGSAIGGDYGLLGLLSVIRMTDADRNRLALGSDLTLLGLNLNSTDTLHSTFGGPFSDKPVTREPHYQVSYFCFFVNS